MSQFWIYFDLGREHILDINGIDHILCDSSVRDLPIARLEKDTDSGNSFTIGHSITLALSTLEIVNFRSDIIEFLISVSIFITAFSNLFRKTKCTYTRQIQHKLLLRSVLWSYTWLGLFQLPEKYAR